MLHLSENIKKIRELLNKTQIEFAEFLDVKDKKGKFSKDKIQSYESARADAPEWLIEKIANLANVSVADLKNKKINTTEITINPLYLHTLIERLKKKNENNNLMQGAIQQDVYINSLLKQIESKDSEISTLKKLNSVLEMQSSVNSKTADSARLLMMGQLTEIMKGVAEIYSAGNKKKYDAMMAAYRKRLGEIGEVKI